MDNIEKGFKYEKQIKSLIIENTNHNAYLWNECPELILIKNNLIKSPEHNKNIRKAIKEGTLHNHKDIGIDIIQVDSNDVCVGIIQCKNGYLNGVCIKDIAGIMTRSAFNKLLPAIIYYTDKLSSNLNMLINLNTNVYKTDFSKINYESNHIYFIKEPYITDKIISDITPVIFTAYDYQLEAVSKIEENFKITNRSILAIPCGCGKTYISYLISLGFKKIVIISPLIEFASQNLSRYIEYGYDENNTILINSDGIRDIEVIKTKIKQNENLIISSTFKSMDIINQCLDLFDEETLFIIDEFHNLSKNNISDKDDDIYKLLISHHKILFMSATPRIYDIEYLDDDDDIQEEKEENEEINSDDDNSNEDYDEDYEDEDDYEEKSIIDYDSRFDELFGTIVYNMSLTDAIINKYITDYKIWLPSIHENNEKLKEELSIYDIDESLKNRCLYLLSCLLNNGSRKTIIYCKDTNDMNSIIDSVNKLNDFYNLDIDIYSISCENTNKERKKILKSFSENDDKIQLLFNIKILNECIDIPSCDSIYISYPPKNKITTIQRINRATRINKNNPHKIANIYIWCDEYEEILETLSSIKEYDSMFKDKIKINTVDFYHNRNDKELELVENDKILLSNYTLEIKEFKCLTWIEKLELLEKYVIEYSEFPSQIDKDKNIKQLGSWLSQQKINYKNKNFIMKNEEIRKQWEEFIEKYIKYFKTYIEKWIEKLNKLEYYIVKNEKLPSSHSKYINIKQLGIWLLRQKRNYKNNKDSMKNREIRKQWEEFIEKYEELFKTNKKIWIDNLNKVKIYINKYNQFPSTASKDKNISNLPNWLCRQKINYKNNEHIMNDEEIRKQWEEFIEKYSYLFKTDIEIWKENLFNIEEYIIKYNKLPIKESKDKNIYKLGNWLSNQKTSYKNNERIMKNEEIRKQWEEFIEKYSYLFKTKNQLWYDNLKNLEEFIIKNEKMPTESSKDKNISNLCKWLYHQKINYKNNEGIIIDEEIKIKWEEFTEKYKELFKSNKELWIDNLKKLEEYILENNKLPPQKNDDKNISKLGKWLSHQKQNYKNNKGIMQDEENKKEWEEFIEKYSVYMN